MNFSLSHFSQHAQSRLKYVVLKILVKIKEYAFQRYALVRKAFPVNVRQDSPESYAMYQWEVAKTTFEGTSQPHPEIMNFSWANYNWQKLFTVILISWIWKCGLLWCLTHFLIKAIWIICHFRKITQSTKTILHLITTVPRMLWWHIWKMKVLSGELHVTMTPNHMMTITCKVIWQPWTSWPIMVRSFYFTHAQILYLYFKFSNDDISITPDVITYRAWGRWTGMEHNSRKQKEKTHD